ncbi:hypothetical protein ACFL6E_00790 [Candidatus Neomarinimicrobiota bacterium]
MVTIGSLWLAIVVSAVFVWIGSAIMHMVLPHHKTDYAGLPDEGAVSGLADVPPGRYDFPHIADMKDMKDEGVIARFSAGPVGFVTIIPKGIVPMGKNLGLSFVHNLVVGFLVAYITAATLGADATYLAVFRVAGFSAWLAYSWAFIPDAIWFGRPWSDVLKYMIDGLVYACLTAGVFGWLW